MHRLDFAFFMLNKIKQLLLSLACMIILLHAVIPHHHHQGKPVCVNELEQQDCEKHNKCCDFGGQDDNHDFDKGNCIIDDYFTPKKHLEFKIFLDSTSLPNYYLNSLVKISLKNIIINKGNDFRRDFISFIYHNPHVNSIFGLRAPPRF